MLKSISIGGKPLDKVMAATSKFKLDPVNFSDAKLSFEFVDGRVYVEPFKVPLGKTTATIQGSNGFDETIDYLMTLAIPRDEMGGQVNHAINSLLGQANDASGLNLTMSDNINLNVSIGGTMLDPKIKTALAQGEGENGEGGMKDALKEKAKAELDKAKEELKKKAKEEADRLKQEGKDKLEKEKEKAKKELEAKAKAEVEKLKKELAAKAKKAAEEKLKKEAADKAKNALNGLFKK